ncbi:protein of unknown function (plasmid) [Rhodovastum atsumiense]|nr:protein of unknown function [Rhodovastum atsumiense]
MRRASLADLWRGERPEGAPDGSDLGVPFFFKQTGSRREAWPGVTGKGDNPAEWPDELRVQQFPGAPSKTPGRVRSVSQDGAGPGVGLNRQSRRKGGPIWDFLSRPYRFAGSDRQASGAGDSVGGWLAALQEPGASWRGATGGREGCRIIPPSPTSILASG